MARAARRTVKQAQLEEMSSRTVESGRRGMYAYIHPFLPTARWRASRRSAAPARARPGRNTGGRCPAQPLAVVAEVAVRLCYVVPWKVRSPTGPLALGFR